MKVQICSGKKCTESGAGYIKKRLLSDIQKLNVDIEIEDCLCQGNCKNSPNIVMNSEIFEKQNPSIASKIFLEKIAIVKKELTKNTGK